VLLLLITFLPIFPWVVGEASTVLLKFNIRENEYVFAPKFTTAKLSYSFNQDTVSTSTKAAVSCCIAAAPSSLSTASHSTTAMGASPHTLLYNLKPVSLFFLL
jgi:hypothetical protein